MSVYSVLIEQKALLRAFDQHDKNDASRNYDLNYRIIIDICQRWLSERLP